MNIVYTLITLLLFIFISLDIATTQDNIDTKDMAPKTPSVDDVKPDVPNY
jgi:hypothetical protein